MQYANCNVQPSHRCWAAAKIQSMEMDRFSHWVWESTLLFSTLEDNKSLFELTTELNIQYVITRSWFIRSVKGTLEIQFSSTKQHAEIMSRLMFSCVTLCCGDDRGWAECCSTPPVCAKERKHAITKAADRNRLEGTCLCELQWIYNICSMQESMPPPLTKTGLIISDTGSDAANKLQIVCTEDPRLTLSSVRLVQRPWKLLNVCSVSGLVWLC